jgi:hypothetical protein
VTQPDATTLSGDAALLRLCAGPSGEIRAAWRTWLDAMPDLLVDGEPAYPAYWRDLLPMAAWRQRELGLDGPTWLLRRLRTAWVLEERRLAAVRETVAEVIAEPALAPGEPLAIGGLALGETLYPDPACRHTGLQTLMLRAGTRLMPIAAALQAKGYRIRRTGWRARHLPFHPVASLWLQSPSGFHVMLLSMPGWRQWHPLAHASLMRDAEWVQAGTLRFQVPSRRAARALAAQGLGCEQGTGNLMVAVDAALLDADDAAAGSAWCVASGRRDDSALERVA